MLVALVVNSSRVSKHPSAIRAIGTLRVRTQGTETESSEASLRAGSSTFCKRVRVTTVGKSTAVARPAGDGTAGAHYSVGTSGLGPLRGRQRFGERIETEGCQEQNNTDVEERLQVSHDSTEVRAPNADDGARIPEDQSRPSDSCDAAELV